MHEAQAESGKSCWCNIHHIDKNTIVVAPSRVMQHYLLMSTFLLISFVYYDYDDDRSCCNWLSNSETGDISRQIFGPLGRKSRYRR
jgi:hypothetical protein